jgi:hypothetical protein
MEQQFVEGFAGACSQQMVGTGVGLPQRPISNLETCHIEPTQDPETEVNLSSAFPSEEPSKLEPETHRSLEKEMEQLIKAHESEQKRSKDLLNKLIKSQSTTKRLNTDLNLANVRLTSATQEYQKALEEKDEEIRKL